MAEEPIFFWTSLRDSFSLQKHGFVTLVISSQSIYILVFSTHSFGASQARVTPNTPSIARLSFRNIYNTCVLYATGIYLPFWNYKRTPSKIQDPLYTPASFATPNFPHDFACVRPVGICAISSSSTRVPTFSGGGTVWTSGPPTFLKNCMGLAHPLLALLSFIFVLLITTDHRLFPGLAHPLSKSFRRPCQLNNSRLLSRYFFAT